MELNARISHNASTTPTTVIVRFTFKSCILIRNLLILCSKTSGLPAELCSDASIQDYCPKTCKLCQDSTTITDSTTTLTDSCRPLPCAYGHIFDAAACICTCQNGFSGTLCEIYDCNSGYPDAPECDFIECQSADDPDKIFWQYCPNKCLCTP